MQRQQTLASAIEFEGVGLHTGADTRVRVSPQADGSGLHFVLGGGAVRFPAHAEYVVETRRATVMGVEGHTVSTVEHVLSALFAMGVDNADIEIDGPEVPVLDGSAAPYVRAIEAVGLRAGDAVRRTLRVTEPLSVDEGDAVLIAVPSETFRVTFAVEFAPPVGAQFIDVAIEPGFYRDEIAAARTFGYVHEVEALRAAGLARGGSLDNALVFAPDGPLTPLRWPNEVVRHKVLDLLGDFALLGAWPLARIVAVKSGHRLHARATRALRERFVPTVAMATSPA
jgi:UDP-3-O-[3-hydroxymyristoyl] N-acetylglucosamine deacetylase